MLNQNENNPTTSSTTTTTGTSGPDAAPASPEGAFPRTRLIEISGVATENGVRHRGLNSDHVKEMVESIELHGLLQPIVVRRTSSGYDLVAGAHRIEAMKELGRQRIEAVVLDDLGDADAEAASLVENLKRLVMTGTALTNALSRLKELQDGGAGARRPGRPKNDAPRTGIGPLQIAGVSKHKLKRADLRKRKTAPKVWAAWDEGEISDAQVDELVKLPADKQEELLSEVIDKTRDETRELVKKARRPRPAEPQVTVQVVGANVTSETEEVGEPNHLVELTRLAEDLSKVIRQLDVAGADLGTGDEPQRKLREVFLELRHDVEAVLGKLQPPPPAVIQAIAEPPMKPGVADAA